MTSRLPELLSCCSRKPWDVIVVGAGPAGAVAARQIALHGNKTLLIDAKSFPRDKVCGGYISARALATLQQIGLTTEMVESNTTTVREVELVMGTRRTHFALPPGRVIDRANFDFRLVKSAQDAGVHFVDRTQAVIQPIVRDATRLITATYGNERVALRAKVVVCADGLSRTSLRLLPEFACAASPNSRVGIGAIVQASVDFCPFGQIKMVVSPQGYVGISRISRNELNVAAAVDPEVLRRATPYKIVTSILSQANVLVPPALSTSSWRGTPYLTSQPMRVAGKRIFVVGDAGGYVEPFTGEGIASAFEAAVAVASLAKSAAENWESSLITQWESIHKQVVQDRQRTCKHLAWVLRRPWVASVAINACRLAPWLANRVIARITRPTSEFCLGRLGSI